jgi:hypothetical protein
LKKREGWDAMKRRRIISVSPLSGDPIRQRKAAWIAVRYNALSRDNIRKLNFEKSFSFPRFCAEKFLTDVDMVITRLKRLSSRE